MQAVGGELQGQFGPDHLTFDLADQSNVQDWIAQNGHSGSVFMRYGQWLGVVPGCRTASVETSRPMLGSSATASLTRSPQATQ